MNKVLLEVIGLSYSHSQSGAYALVLGDKNSNLKLPIIIGSVEAQSIAMAIEGHEVKRPLTHDLFKTFAGTYGITVREVVISSFKEGVFFSQIVCEKDGETSVLDARSSDAVALAVRFKCPIYASKQVMDEAGLFIDDMDLNDDGNNKNDETDDRSIEELKEMMEKAVEEEDYELASKLRDEIKSKENQ